MKHGLAKLLFALAICLIATFQFAGTHTWWGCGIVTPPTKTLTRGFPSDYVVMADDLVIVGIQLVWLAFSQKYRRRKRS